MATLAQIRAAMTGFPRPLTWNDFRPVPAPLDPPHTAKIRSTWQMGPWRVGRTGGKYQVQGVRVTVSFDPSLTWATPAARSDASLLVHEQGHYDITGLIARDLVRSVLNLEWDEAVVASLRGTGNSPQQHQRWVQQQFQNSINELSTHANRLLARLQTDPATGNDGIYDQQTNHGLNAAPQGEWTARLQRVASANDSLELFLIMAGVL